MGNEARILFLADMPSVGYKVFEVSAAASPVESSRLSVTPSSLENARYTVKLDANGDMASVFDKEARERIAP